MKVRLIMDAESIFFELEEENVKPEDIPKLVDAFCEAMEYLKVKDLIKEEEH